MYFPKNKIKTNLYTRGGELVSKLGSQFQGYYWKDHRGRFFSGKTPNSPNQVELFNLSVLGINDLGSDNTITEYKGPGIVPLQNTIYSVIKQIKGGNNYLNKILLPHTKPSPNPSNYRSKFWRRYFFYKVNTKVWGEFDNKTFRDIRNNPNKYALNLYNTFSVRWLISGDREKAINNNTNVISSISRAMDNNGLEKYIRYNYLEYYQENPDILDQTGSITTPPTSQTSTYTPPPSPTSPPTTGGGFSGGGGY